MRRLFIDTGYLIALESSDDQHHEAARRHWQRLISQRPRFVTTSYVFDEVVTFFNARGRHAKAVEIGQRLRLSPSVEFLYVDEALFEAGWDYFQPRSDKRYSLTDCISFVVMEKEEIEEALTFDQHFAQAGFKKLPAGS